MKTILLVSALAAIPAFAAAGSNVADYYQQSQASSPRLIQLEHTDGNLLPSANQPGSSLQAPADSFTDDHAAISDGAGTSGMFHGERR
jgi:hypothetical protein